MNQRMAGRRPQVVEGGWLGQVIDQGVKVRFGRNRNGAEVGIRAPRAKVFEALWDCGREVQTVDTTASFQQPCLESGQRWSAECSWRSAGRVQR